jgi:hypothetical protein
MMKVIHHSTSMSSTKRILYALALTTLTLFVAQPSSADTSNGYLVDHGIAIYYAVKDLARIAGGDVSATVGELGLTGERKQLEPFTVTGALTYGNYFDLRPHAEYRVRIDVKAPRFKDEAHAEFEFKTLMRGRRQQHLLLGRK